MTGNLYNFYLYGYQDSNYNNSIDTSNSVDGKPILYIKSGADAVYDSSSNAGTVYCVWCNNVTIKDMTVKKEYYGIFFWNTSSSKAENIISSNNNEGIHLDYSSNNMLSSNTVSNNGNGISLYTSSNNMLSGNNASNNSNYGIYLSSSNNTMLSGNNASDNSNYGIYLYFSSNNTLSGNNASNDYYGIFLSSSSNNMLNGNNASNNYIYNCGYSGCGYGIYLSSSNNTMLSGNNASNNHYGIQLDYSSNNNIYNNNFIKNAIQASDNYGNNTWDSGYPSGGNNWSDYTGNDSNGDGIGDTPYSIHGSSNSTDRYPLMKPWETTINPTPTPSPSPTPTVTPTPTPTPTPTAKPIPVILVHGLMEYNESTEWAETMKTMFTDQGFNVSIFNYEGVNQKIQVSAYQLMHKIKEVKDEYNTDKVDIVGHSEGGIVVY
jgi:parallel beta-helix repeat protein